MSPTHHGWAGSARAGAAVLAFVLGLASCSEQPPTGLGVDPAPPPSNEPTIAGSIQGIVNGATGTVTFEPVGAPPTARRIPGFSAAVYGTQNVDVRLYATPLIVDSTTDPGWKTWSFRLGVRNYLDYPIGSNQASAQPRDTSGIFAVLVSGPTVTRTSGACPAPCAVTVGGTDGVGNFVAPGQPYLYWPERLAAKQPVAGADTTSTRRLLSFTTPAAVTSFRFALLVRAAWPPPHDSSWSVYYNAATDSLPDAAAEPRWKRQTITAFGRQPGSASWAPGGLMLTARNGQNIYLYRSDSLAANEPAYIEAQFKLNGKSKQTDAENVFGLQDDTHLLAVGITDGEAGFVRLTPTTISILGFVITLRFQWDFVGPTHSLGKNGAQQLHTYRLRKFGADSASLEIDGVRALTLRGSQLPAASDLLPGATTLFGVSSESGDAKTTWSSVAYGLGVDQP